MFNSVASERRRSFDQSHVTEIKETWTASSYWSRFTREQQGGVLKTLCESLFTGYFVPNSTTCVLLGNQVHIFFPPESGSQDQWISQASWLKMSSFSQIAKTFQEICDPLADRRLISPAMIFELGQGGVKVATSVCCYPEGKQKNV